MDGTVIRDYIKGDQIMAEVKEMDQVPQADTLQESAPAPADTGGEQTASRKPMSPKKKRKLIRRIVALVIVAALAAAGFKFLGGKGKEEAQVITDFVSYGAITSTVEGSGITKAKNSETITLTTAGTVVDVMVTEGEQVTAGTPLFTIDSEAARTAVQKAESDLKGY